MKQLDFTTTQHGSSIGNKTKKETLLEGPPRCSRKPSTAGVFNHKQNPRTSSYETRGAYSVLHVVVFDRVRRWGRYFTESSSTSFK